MLPQNNVPIDTEQYFSLYTDFTRIAIPNIKKCDATAISFILLCHFSEKEVKHFSVRLSYAERKVETLKSADKRAGSNAELKKESGDTENQVG